MRYLPNQYINPALTIRDREIAREPNMEDAPYRLFKRDTSTDDPEDYRGKPAYGVEEDGQGFFTFPFVQAPDKKNTNKGMKIAGAQDPATKMHILNSGLFVDENQIKYMWSPREQKFIDMGPYDPYYDGLPIPLGQRNTDMKIAKKNKRKSQRAYEDFVKDSGSQPLDEQLMDMDRGRMGGGLDILDRLFPRA